MPIQFRCHQCRQVLSITSKKAGTLVNCPNCREATRVPTLEDVQAAVSAAQHKRETVAAKEERAAVSKPVSAGPQAGAELWEQAEVVKNPWLDDEADEEVIPRIKSPKFDDSGLDMTPMVDVTFLLLIFFMITASFNIQKSLQANPPEPEDEGAAQTVTIEDQPQDDILVGISANDELTLDDEPISSVGALADALQGRIAAGGTELSMTIEADPRCTFGIMVSVMDTGIASGMQSIKRVSRPVDE